MIGSIPQMVECCSQYFGQVEHAEVQQKIMQNGTLDSHLRTQCIETEYGREQRARDMNYSQRVPRIQFLKSELIQLSLLGNNKRCRQIAVLNKPRFRS